MKIKFTLDDGATAPTRAHDTDAGLDLYSSRGCPINPGERRLVSTGVHVSIPPGYVGMICPRSGLAHKHGLTVLNAPGRPTSSSPSTAAGVLALSRWLTSCT